MMAVEESDKQTLFIEYFSHLFAHNTINFASILRLARCKIDNEENNFLMALVTVEEAKVAVFQMGPDKALGPDGLNPTFYQKF